MQYAFKKEFAFLYGKVRQNDLGKSKTFLVFETIIYFFV